MTAQASNTGPLICRLILMPNDPLGQINSNNPHPCLSSLLAQRSEARGSRARTRAVLQVHGEHPAQVLTGDGRGPMHPERLQNGGRGAAVLSFRPKRYNAAPAFPSREHDQWLWVRGPLARGPRWVRGPAPAAPLSAAQTAGVHLGTGLRPCPR